MSESKVLRRVIVCVEEAYEPLAVAKNDAKCVNETNISRIHRCIRQGQFIEPSGQIIEQNAKYYQAIVPTHKLASNKAGEQQIQDIALDICRTLHDARDEIFLFGAGRGAYTVRAVAGILHHMGMPRSGYLNNFSELYEATLKLIKARQNDDAAKGRQALEYLRIHTSGSPNIRFMGLLDATASPLDRGDIDISMVSSIKHLRHAMAFNENRAVNSLDSITIPPSKELLGRSCQQAWFLGYHSDMTGGTQHDGLSVYPLQWLFIEALLQGLAGSYDSKDNSSENPIGIMFPQYAGAIPDLSGKEKVHWQIKYTNNAVINMFDPHSIHNSKIDAAEASHSIHFPKDSRFQGTPRKIFSKDGLIGYNSDNESGVIIHPSVFCILSRNQRFYEQYRFKPYKDNLADVEVNCLKNETDGLPPWLQDSELLASGVKAFRILVCGKTGVGKSTLINKVFGVEMVGTSIAMSRSC